MEQAKTVAELKEEIKLLKKQLSDKAKANEIKDKGVLENEKYMKEMVTIKLFKDNGKYKDDVYVNVNDKSYLIRRGAEVTVPRYIEQALKNSLSQDEYVASLVERLSSDYVKNSAK